MGVGGICSISIHGIHSQCIYIYIYECAPVHIHAQVRVDAGGEGQDDSKHRC